MTNEELLNLLHLIQHNLAMISQLEQDTAELVEAANLKAYVGVMK